MDVDNGFFMVKCKMLADREKNMSEGSWMFFDHYLVVPWWTRGEDSGLDLIFRA